VGEPDRIGAEFPAYLEHVSPGQPSGRFDSGEQQLRWPAVYIPIISSAVWLGCGSPMGMAEKYHQKNVELIQQVVPEPVTTAAILQRKGQMGANLTGGFAAGASLAAHGDAKKAAPGFPENTILGMSANQLYAFKLIGVST